MSRAPLAFVIVILIGTVGAAAPPSVVLADLEGQPIPATAVADHNCHDFDWPQIHCYRTAAALDAAAQAFLRSESTSLSGTRPSKVAAAESEMVTAAATKYVKIFQWGAYAGNVAYLSRDYSNLDEIGWGDKISSYIVYNSASGEFYNNPGYGGAIDYYCCNQSVPGLSTTFDNQFSAFDLN